MVYMMDINEIRHRNVRMLVAQLEDAAGKSGDRAGGLVMLAAKLNKAAPQVSHFAAEKPTKNIGEKIAREIEDAFGLERGWLDWAQWAPSPGEGPSRSMRFDREMLEDVISVLARRAKLAGVEFDQRPILEFAEVYEMRSAMPTEVLTPQNALSLALSFKSNTPQGFDRDERSTSVPANGTPGSKVGKNRRR
jgi:hypothetical protein